LSEDKKILVEEEERINSGSLFQMVGAAKEKALRPISELVRGTWRKFLSEDLRFLVGVCGVRR
jgi:hypothetical protein